MGTPLHTTKRYRSAKLLKRVLTGPSHLEGEALEGYKGWVDSWIVPELIRLIPSLKSRFTKEEQGTISAPRKKLKEAGTEG